MEAQRHKRSEVSSVYLPQEIVTDILVRLPVRSLVRFRCVCKSWCSLINNPGFARKNLKHLNSIRQNDNNDIVFLSNIGLYRDATSYGNSATAIFTSTLKSIDPFVFVNDRNKTTVPPVWKFDCSTRLKSCCNTIWGGCDGILCVLLDGGEGILLWNPSINKYKILPPPKSLDPSSTDVGGIGYDPSVDDYKIFWAHRKNGAFNRNSRHAEELQVEVFALKSNSWKTIQGYLPYQAFYGQHSVFTNGGIHLVAKRDEDSSEEVVIVCFNVVTEEFEELQLPCIQNMHHITQLLVIGGKLCFAHRPCGVKIDLWVMNEYGVGEYSWSKLVTISPYSSGWGRFKHLSPICFTKIGTVLLKEKEEDLKVSIVGFEQRDDETYRSLWTGKVLATRQPMIPYVESLISPILSYDN